MSVEEIDTRAEASYVSTGRSNPRTIADDQSHMAAEARQASFPSRIAMVCAVAVAGVVLSVAYYFMFGEFTRDSDQVNTFLMAQDMVNGNLFLSHWWISDDNFWLTDVALEAVLIAAFGVHPTIMFIASAMIWGAIVLLAVWACVKERGWSLAGLLSILMLLALPVLRQNDVMQLIGRTPLHNASTVFILAMMSARMMEGRGTPIEAFILTLITAAGVFSDPLIMVIGSASIALVAAISLLHKPQLRQLLVITVVVGATLAGRIGPVLMQRLGGLNAYHLPLRFVELKDLGSNLWFGLFSLVLLTGTSFFGRTVSQALPFLVRLPFLGLFVWSFWATGLAYVRQVMSAERLRRIKPLDCLLVAAVLINIAAALLSDLLHGPAEVRYFFPALVCGASLCGRALPSKRWLNALVVLAFIGSAGLTAASYLGRAPIVAVFEPGVSGLADKLVAANLTRGYASYWSASVTTSASRNQVHVAAIELNGAGRLQPKLWNSKATWYKDFGQIRPFFVLADKRSIEAQLSDKDIRASFGEPTRRLDVQDFEVLVYQ